jgi:hypothetical protein
MAPTGYFGARRKLNHDTKKLNSKILCQAPFKIVLFCLNLFCILKSEIMLLYSTAAPSRSVYFIVHNLNIIYIRMLFNPSDVFIWLFPSSLNLFSMFLLEFAFILRNYVISSQLIQPALIVCQQYVYPYLLIRLYIIFSVLLFIFFK